MYFAYEPENILNDINLVKPGETVAIVGQTGSGKSSLVNLIARFYEADKGEVAVDAHSVRSADFSVLCRRTPSSLNHPENMYGKDTATGRNQK
jgi:ATP-binding cassette subfamily B protein